MVCRKEKKSRTYSRGYSGAQWVMGKFSGRFQSEKNGAEGWEHENSEYFKLLRTFTLSINIIARNILFQKILDDHICMLLLLLLYYYSSQTNVKSKALLRKLFPILYLEEFCFCLYA